MSSKKSRSGRKPSQIWEYFKPIRTEQNKIHAICKLCDFKCAGVASRMVTHISTKCSGATAEALVIAQNELSTKKRKLEARETEDIVLPTSEMNPQSLGEGSISRSITDFSSNMIFNAVYKKLTLACILENTDSRILQNRYFIEALQYLAPRFPRVSSNQSVLDLVRTSIQADIRRFLTESTYITFIYDHFLNEINWIGVNEKRRSELLDTTKSLNENLSEAKDLIESKTNALNICSSSYNELKQVQDQGHLKNFHLVGVCLLRQTMYLLKTIIESSKKIANNLAQVSAVVDTITKQPVILQALTSLNPLTNEIFSTELLFSKDWFLIGATIKRVLLLEEEIKILFRSLCKEDESICKYPLNDDFWSTLKALDVILSPFHWILSLSETNDTTSGQFVFAWIWILSVIKNSSSLLLDTKEKCNVFASLVTAVKSVLLDHHLVCLLLDPRIHGMGLSNTGKRKVKSLMVEVASRLFPGSGYEDKSSVSRKNLLSQLGDYMERVGQFGDDVLWEMTSGKTPDVFWNDFIDDFPEICQVANALVAFLPQTRSCSMVFSDGSSSAEGKDKTSEKLTENQLRHHFLRNELTRDMALKKASTHYSSLLGIPSTNSSVFVSSELSISSDFASTFSRILAQISNLENVGAKNKVSETIGEFDVSWLAMEQTIELEKCAQVFFSSSNSIDFV